MTQRTTTAVVFEHGEVSLRPLALRPLAPGEVLLRVVASGLCGTDLYKLRHQDQPAQVLGHEIVGEVIDRGEGCRFEDGDLLVAPHHLACGACAICHGGHETSCEQFRVNLFEPGGFCTHTILRRSAVERASYRLPRDLDALSAVFLEPTACVLRGIERSGIERTGLGLEPAPTTALNFAILGAGSMGLLHLLTLRALGFNAWIAVVEPDEERRSLAEKLGADSVLSPEERAPAERTADVVFDTVGTSAALDSGLALARPGGTLVLFAHQPDDIEVTLPLNRMFRAEQRLVATYSSSLREQSLAFELLSTRSLDPRPLVTHQLPLDAFEEAVRLCREGRALKVVFRPEREAATPLAEAEPETRRLRASA